MNVLFISSGNSKYGISPIVYNQGLSLQNAGVNLSYFTIKGKGITGYLKNIFKLHKLLNQKQYDLFHAHYSASSFAASLAGARPLIVSLMGSDVKAGKHAKLLLMIFNKLFWKRCIVKSADMKRSLGIKSANVIPNGIDFNKFKKIIKEEAIKRIGWDKNKKYIVFASDPGRYEKNYKLAKVAFQSLNYNSLELKHLIDIPHDEMPYIYSAADVVLCTSLWEGSSNVIKEAMACNCPIVTTDVGDVNEVIGNTDGSYICSYDPLDVAKKLDNAIRFGKRTLGRNSIKHLDQEIIAKKVVKLYQDALKSK